MTTTDTEQYRADHFNAAHPVGTWVRYWTGTRDGEPKCSRTATTAWPLGEHTAVVRVEGESSCVALTHIYVIPGQPDDIEDDSRDLPDPTRAAERVGWYIAANGDGIYDVIDGHPLYARDLEALRRLAACLATERDDLAAALAEVRAQLTAANRRNDGLQNDLNSATKANTAWANERDTFRAWDHCGPGGASNPHPLHPGKTCEQYDQATAVAR